MLQIIYMHKIETITVHACSINGITILYLRNGERPDTNKTPQHNSPALSYHLQNAIGHSNTKNIVLSITPALCNQQISSAQFSIKKIIQKPTTHRKDQSSTEQDQNAVQKWSSDETRSELCLKTVFTTTQRSYCVSRHHHTKRTFK